MVSSISRREQTHTRIVDSAARAIRRAGYDGVGVADIMKAAGLTHGGFYAHFANRDALLVEAVDQAGAAGVQHLVDATARREARGASRFEALVRAYLADGHIAAVEHGCPIAALLSEMPRQTAAVQAASRRRIHAFVAIVRERLPAGAPPEAAETVASMLVGALQLARALGDNPQGRAFLAAQRAALMATFGGATVSD
jgi:TetR/AcrR family transcriptional regulator, transcriptional repressor for nem operon